MRNAFIAPSKTGEMRRNMNPNGPSKDVDADLRVLFWNAGGLNSSKFLEFRHTIYNVDADVYFIFEAGLSTENPEMYQTDGYTIHALKRARQVASGIYTGIKDSVIAKYEVIHEMERADILEAVQVLVWKHKQKFSVIGLYNPPGNKPDTSVLTRYSTINSIIVGDFNAPSRRWGYSHTTPTGRIIEDFLDEELLEVIDTPPTFLSFAGGTSRPDLVMVHPSLINKTCVDVLDDASGCGHRAILVTGEIKKKNISQPIRAPRWNFKKGRWQEYKDLSDRLVTVDIVTGNPEVAYRKLCEAIIKAASRCIPRGQVKVHKPFWNATLAHLKKRRNKARRAAEKSGRLDDCVMLRRAQAELQRNIKEGKRNSYQQFVTKLDFRKDGLKAHRFISRLNNESTRKELKPMMVGNRTLTDTKAIANAMCANFAKVSNVHITREEAKGLKQKEIKTCLSEQDSGLFADQFSIKELNVALSKVQLRKAAGSDNIFPEFLTHLGSKAKEALLAMINLSWRTHIPDQWRKGEITPLLKKGKPAEEITSFRPITLTSSVCKLAERMVVARLNKHLEEKGLIDEEQAGFRRHRGTMDQVTTFAQHVKDGFHRQMSTVAVMVDIKAAYDRVWRALLLHKLSEKCGIGGNMRRWVKSFLAQRQIRVRFRNATSKYRIQREGLPQGAVLSCLLFNVMINDVLAAVKAECGVNAVLYADDLLIWATSQNRAALEACLNSALKRLAVWADSNKMLVSTEKSVFQLFTLSTKPFHPNIEYKGAPLEEQTITNYLGVAMDSKMNWSAHIDAAAEKGTKRCRLLKRLAGTKWGADQEVLSTAYKTYVRPSMEYGAEVMATASSARLSRLDKVQNTALRVITGAAKSTPIKAMEVQAGVEPLEARRDKAALKIWERMKRTRPDFWNSYQAANSRLRTHIAPRAKAAEIAIKYGIDLGEPAPLNNCPELFENLPGAYLTLEDHTAVKSQSLNIELQKSALKTISIRFPEPAWLRIYTDGSYMPESGATGAGYFCHLFEGHMAVGTPLSCFDGEVTAIAEAVNQLKNTHTHKKAVFLVDSHAAIQAVTSNSDTDCHRTIQCRRSLNELCQGEWTIAVQWVPSHVGLYGNEKADDLAKKGTTLQQPRVPAALASVKNAINLKCNKVTREQQLVAAMGKTWERLVTTGPIDRNLPRQVAVAAFRTTTGHDYLATHLQRIGVLPSSACTMCGHPSMVAEHLHTCPGLEDAREESILSGPYLLSSLYWLARHRMAEASRVGVG